jgi:hypothetical protein
MVQSFQPFNPVLMSNLLDEAPAAAAITGDEQIRESGLVRTIWD